MSKDKEVYIGNGVTVDVTHESFTRILDRDKALNLYLENINKEFYIGMSQDWFFTASQVRKVLDIENYHCRASSWDKPCVEIDGEKIDCYIEIPNYMYSLAFDYGYARGKDKTTFWFRDLLDTVHQLEYENIKAMQKEINEVVAKYQNKRTDVGMYNLELARTKLGKKIQDELEELKGGKE